MKPATYRNYLLTVLLVILAFNFVDRLALGMVLQDIKKDFDLTDTQLGLLSGIAFALFYSVMGIPIARWADRGNRVTIISLTAALWSVALALCALAGSFLQLLLIRVGVAVGEAGCIPPAHSLISDYFTRAERPRAFARYMLAVPLSVFMGYFLAGWLNEIFGWRVTFTILGLPGVGLAALTWFTIKEPRVANPVSQAAASTPPSLKEVWTTLWANATFRHLLFSFSVLQFFAFGIGQWQPTFFIRSFGLQTGELGTWFAVIYGLGGLLGTYLGGEWAARYAAQNERMQLRVAAILLCSCGIISACMYLSSSLFNTFALMSLCAVAAVAANGPLLATIQTLVPDRMRAVAIALVFLFANFIGMGLGPLASGALSDLLRPHFGDESLRYALLALCPGYLWCAWHLWRGSNSVTRDIKTIQADSDIAGVEDSTAAELRSVDL